MMYRHSIHHPPNEASSAARRRLHSGAFAGRLTASLFEGRTPEVLMGDVARIAAKWRRPWRHFGRKPKWAAAVYHFLREEVCYRGVSRHEAIGLLLAVTSEVLVSASMKMRFEECDSDPCDHN